MRKLHRWVSTFAVVFLAWVSLTGVALGIDAMWPPGGLDRSVAPAPPAETGWVNDIQFRLKLHNLLQDLHRGSIVGIPGQLIDVLTGFCFVFLSISGVVIYVELVKRRRKNGRRALVWGRTLSMRSTHRWIGSMLSLLLMYLFVTGTATGIAQLLDPESARPIPPPGEMMMPPGTGSPTERPRPPRGQPPNGDLPLSAFLQDLHSGHTFGRLGEWAMLLTGIATVFLTLSGMWLYVTMLRQRRRNDRAGYFW